LSYDYFNHLRLKHLPKTDLSGLKLEFDIEYDQALDGAIRLDAAKYPSVTWDAMTFVTGSSDSHEVRLLAYSERWRSPFRDDGDRDSELMPITIPR
jgi:hypothetical protein